MTGSQGGHTEHLSCHRTHPSDNHKYWTDHFQPIFPSITLPLAFYFFFFVLLLVITASKDVFSSVHPIHTPKRKESSHLSEAEKKKIQPKPNLSLKCGETKDEETKDEETFKSGMSKEREERRMK